MNSDDEDAQDVVRRVRGGEDAGSLAALLERRARTPFELAVKLADEPNTDLEMVASLLACRSQELAVVPFTAGRGASAENRGWALRTVADQETTLRRDVITWLQMFLRDRSGGPGPRLCDEALVALRGLLQFDEVALGPGFNEKKFLAMTETERNGLIQTALKSRAMDRVVPKGDEE